MRAFWEPTPGINPKPYQPKDPPDTAISPATPKTLTTPDVHELTVTRAQAKAERRAANSLPSSAVCLGFMALGFRVWFRV